jgi:hypothetical protein
MLAQLINQSDILFPQRLEDDPSNGFVRRALAISGRSPFGVAASSARTRRDFLHALQILGAKSNRCRLNGDPLPRMIPIHLSCPYQTWLKVFGRPRQLEKHGKPSAGVAVHTWKHECEDGAVTCIGQVSERLPGLRWIVVMRVGLYG